MQVKEYKLNFSLCMTNEKTNKQNLSVVNLIKSICTKLNLPMGNGGRIFPRSYRKSCNGKPEEDGIFCKLCNILI